MVAAERLGRWCVPGPVTESIAVAPILLADDERAQRRTGVGRTDRDRRAAATGAARRRRRYRGSGPGGRRGEVRDGTAGEQTNPSTRSRKLFDVNASGEGKAADVARAYEFGVLATAAQLVGAGQALLDMSVEYAKQRSQFGRVIGRYQAIKHKLADVHIALELARPLVYGAALSVADESPETARDISAAKVAASDAALLAARRRCRRTVPSGSRKSTTCRCGCCGCRRCARRGVIPHCIGDAYWRHCE